MGDKFVRGLDIPDNCRVTDPEQVQLMRESLAEIL
jgi:hypothetical protein